MSREPDRDRADPATGAPSSSRPAVAPDGTKGLASNGRPLESVWDYPRPPRIEPSILLVQVEFAGQQIAESRRTHRVLETSHPPVFYVPLADVDARFLRRTSRRSFCEWKGSATYYDIIVGDRQTADAAWKYPNPSEHFAAIRDAVAFYPSKVDQCRVAGEIVVAQAGDFYGGWITSEIEGPFKGGRGTEGW